MRIPLDHAKNEPQPDLEIWDACWQCVILGQPRPFITGVEQVRVGQNVTVLLMSSSHKLSLHSADPYSCPFTLHGNIQSDSNNQVFFFLQHWCFFFFSPTTISSCLNNFIKSRTYAPSPWIPHEQRLQVPQNLFLHAFGMWKDISHWDVERYCQLVVLTWSYFNKDLSEWVGEIFEAT